MAKVVIVGGGPAGLACAAELSERGTSCVVLERRDGLGGRVNDLACKGTVKCRQCDVCRALRLREQVLASPNVQVHTGVRLEQVERSGGRYRFDLHRFKEAIDTGRCSRCRKCVEACPTGAMRADGGRISFDRDRCRTVQGLECERCVTVCPTGAIDLFGEEHLSVTGEAVVVATGAREFDPSEDPRLGHGTVPGVMTSMELESALEEGSHPALVDRARVAFVLCVGSRTCKAGTQACSAVCCAYSLRQALAVKERFPSTVVTMFIMDWRGIGEGDPLLEELDRTDIRVVRSRPAETVAVEGLPHLRYEAEGAIREEPFDLVVLAVGLVPDTGDDLGHLLALPRDELGNLSPRNCRERGILLAGSCLEPKDIKRCVVDGTLAARRALEMLEGRDD